MSLSVTDATLRRGEIAALDGVSATLSTGTMTAIVGPNGAGKSTLLSVMAGLLNPDHGFAAMDGVALAQLSPRARAQAIGYLPQGGAAAWRMQARDIVALGRLPHGDRDPDAILAAMGAVDALALADRRIDQLSGGEVARVLLARVLAGTPRWILADEPVAQADPPHAAATLRHLRAQAAGGRGVAVVLHDLDAAARCDRVILMARGRIVADGPPDVALAPAPLHDAFGAQFDHLVVHGRRVIRIADA